MIFYISIFTFIIAKIIELLVGISNGYHPDSIHYINDANQIIFDNFSIGIGYGLINTQLMYFISFILMNNSSAIIFLNIIFASIANQFFYNSYKKNINIFVIFLIILNPYKVHFGLHVLKEIYIISLLQILICTVNYKSKFLIFSLLFFTRKVASYIYIFFYFYIFRFNYKYKILSIIIIFASITYNFDLVYSQIHASNLIDMRTRSYDLIPSYQENGLIIGSLFRFIFYPIYSMFFVGILYNANLVLLFTFTSLFINTVIIYKLLYKNYKPAIINFVIVTGLLAVIVPGFTSYMRYLFIFQYIFIFAAINFLFRKK